MSSCPKCRQKSHVLRTDMDEAGTKRRRECLSCSYRWTTVESIQDGTGLPTVERPENRIVGTWNSRFGEGRTDGRRPRVRADREAIEAAQAVDNRKREIKARQAAERMKEREAGDAWDDGFDRAPRRLTRQQLMREIFSTDTGYSEDGE